MIRQALDLGMTLVDTADVYGPFTNEELVGRALADGYRERAVLATKVGLVVDPDSGTTPPGTGRNGRPGARPARRSTRACAGSAPTTSTSTSCTGSTPRCRSRRPGARWRRRSPPARRSHLGLSEVTAEEIRRAHAVHPVASVQSELSLWTRDPLAEVLPYCEAQGIAFLPFSPLGRGFLTGRFSSFDDLPQDDFRRRLPRFQPEALRANLAIVDRVQQVAERTDATPAQVALAWVLAQGRYVVPIPGTKTPRFLDDNAGAADVRLSEEDLAELDAMPAPAGGRY